MHGCMHACMHACMQACMYMKKYIRAQVSAADASGEGSVVVQAVQGLRSTPASWNTAVGRFMAVSHGVDRLSSLKEQ